MSSNKLVINDQKTHLVVFCKKTMNNLRQEVKIQAGEHEILASRTEKLLGANISQDLRWNNHLVDNKKSLLKQINNRMSGLKLVSRRTNFKTRLMIANSVFMSKLCYLIELWGGSSEYILKSLQTMQNKVGKVVT